jgi:Flp pilus assembly protein TadG
MIALLAVTGFTVDVGSWYRAQRHAVSVADASVLAGAQALPEDTSKASALANDYASKNDGALDTLKFSTKYRKNDTITATVKEDKQAFFSKVLGINSATVRSLAAAIAGPPSSAPNVSPITVDDNNPQLQCGPACFGPTVQLSFNHDGDYPGVWTEAGVANLKGSGNPSPSEVAGWISNTFPGPVELKSYPGFPPSMFNSKEVQDALKGLIGQSIIVLVHSSGGPQGKGPYDEIGWAKFLIQTVGIRPDGISGYMTGYFTTGTVRGTPSPNPSDPYFGVKAIQLTQ